MTEVDFKNTNTVIGVRTSRALIPFFICALLLVVAYHLDNNKTPADAVVFEKETGYYLARVVDSKEPATFGARILFLDFDSHSIEYKDSNVSTPSYTSIYPVFQVLKKGAVKNVSVIGGGAYTLSKNILDFYEDSEITVVEIDAEVSNIAREYFTVEEERITTINKDARVYFNHTDNTYDLIFGDAYNSFISVPWHLATLEFTKLVSSKLRGGGAYSVNFISSISGDGAQFFRAMIKTFSKVFSNYYVFAFGENSDSTQNIVLVGIKVDDKAISYLETKEKLAEMQSTSALARHLVDTSDIDLSDSIIFTDDFAPVEHLMIPTMNRYFRSYNNFYKSVFNTFELHES